MISKTKPTATVRSSIYSQFKTRYWCFLDIEYIFDDTELTFAVLKALIDDGTITMVEVYDVESSSADDGVAEIGGREKDVSYGEQRYTGNIVTTMFFDKDFSYFTDKWFFSISEDNTVRFINEEQGNLFGIKLNNVKTVNKNSLSNGTDTNYNAIKIRHDGDLTEKMEEFCLPFRASTLLD